MWIFSNWIHWFYWIYWFWICKVKVCKNLFSSNEYEKNDKKVYCLICGKDRKFEKPKISYNFGKTLVFSIICSKCDNEDEKIFKEEESVEILKALGLI